MSPKEYDQEIADSVCEHIMDGQSLRKIEAIEGMPKRLTILRWLRESVDFQTQYAHAREEQADVFVDEMHEIADDETKDVNHRRLQIDARKWTASKLKPKKYGEKQSVDVDVTSKGESIAAISRLSELAGRVPNVPKP